MSRKENQKRPQDVEFMGTLELAQEFIEDHVSFERTINSKWWSNPVLWWSKTTRAEHLLERINQISFELAVRYEGILGQLFLRMGADGDVEALVSSAWLSVKDACLTMKDYRLFATALWSAYVGSSPTSDTDALKPKFMLRQFVDAITPCSDQGTVLATAYGHFSVAPSAGLETKRSLARAYVLLHDELQQRASQLSLLTNGAISAVIIAEMSAPFGQYERWLFYC